MRKDKNSILSYVAMGAALVLIIGMFLPFIKISGWGVSTSSSYWKNFDGFQRILVLILSLAVIAAFAFNKKTKLCYLAEGYLFFHLFVVLFQESAMDYLSIGFWLMILSSAAMVVATMMYKEEEGVSLVAQFTANKPAPAQPTYSQPVQQPVQQSVNPTDNTNNNQ